MSSKNHKKESFFDSLMFCFPRAIENAFREEARRKNEEKERDALYLAHCEKKKRELESRRRSVSTARENDQYNSRSRITSLEALKKKSYLNSMSTQPDLTKIKNVTSASSVIEAPCYKRCASPTPSVLSLPNPVSSNRNSIHYRETVSNIEIAPRTRKTTRSNTFHSEIPALNLEYQVNRNAFVRGAYATQSLRNEPQVSRTSTLSAQDSSLISGNYYLQRQESFNTTHSRRNSTVSTLTQQDSLSAYSTIKYDNLTRYIDPDAYLKMLLETLEKEIGVKNEFHEKRIFLKNALTVELNKECEKIKNQPDTSIFRMFFSNANKSLLSSMGGGIAFKAAIAPPIGLTLLSISSVFFSYFLTREIFRAIKEKSRYKKLIGLLPREGSLVLPIISALTVLFLKSTLDKIITTKNFTFVKKITPDFMSKLLNSINSKNGCDSIIKFWEKEEKKIVAIAQEYAQKIFKKLELYADNKQPLNNEVFYDLIPKSMLKTDLSPDTLKDSISLTAFLAAFGMFISEYTVHDRLTNEQLLKDIKIKTCEALVRIKPSDSSLADSEPNHIYRNSVKN